MENKIISAVAVKLRKTVGEGFTFYIDEKEQGLSTPCFFIRLLTVTQSLIVRNRYQRNYSFDIEYHPKADGAATRELNEVASALLMRLEYLEVDSDLIRASNMNYTTQSGVLHFFVDYPTQIFRVLEPAENMEKLLQKQNVKG